MYLQFFRCGGPIVKIRQSTLQMAVFVKRGSSGRVQTFLKTHFEGSGFYSKLWILSESTEEQHDESDDKDETLQDTFKKYHMTSQDYSANCDEDLEQFLKDFSDKSEDEDPEVKAKIRKYSQKMEVTCKLKISHLFKIYLIGGQRTDRR